MVAAAVVEGEALVVTSTLGMVVVMTSLPRTQRMQAQSIAKLVLLPSTCVPVFDVVIGLILQYSSTYSSSMDYQEDATAAALARSWCF